MIVMAEKKSKTSSSKKRNTIQFGLDEDTEVRFQRWLDRQRVKPDRAAVGLTAFLEFLEREEKKTGG